MNQALIDLGDYLSASMPVPETVGRIVNDELVLEVPAATVVRALSFLRDDANCLFKVLVDLCGVDYPAREQRFEVVYNLLSLHHNQRIRVKLSVAETTPVPSVCAVYSSAGWYEREAWDLYGIYFAGNPDLGPLRTASGFEGHPLR